MEDKEHEEDTVKREEKEEMEENWRRNGKSWGDGRGEEMEKQGERMRELEPYQ